MESRSSVVAQPLPMGRLERFTGYFSTAAFRNAATLAALPVSTGVRVAHGFRLFTPHVATFLWREGGSPIFADGLPRLQRFRQHRQHRVRAALSTRSSIGERATCDDRGRSGASGSTRLAAAMCWRVGRRGRQRSCMVLNGSRDQKMRSLKLPHRYPTAMLRDRSWASWRVGGR
jgi:hypothetical protein